MSYEVTATDEEWRNNLGPDRFAVLRQAATEPPFTGKYTHDKTEGVYRCGACSAPLFSSNSKFDSGSGWPSFYEPMTSESLELIADRTHGMVRTEVRCARCGSHLGHVFDDGPAPTGQRFCMNSIALDLEPEGTSA
ncbi:MAG TPA: peptide-methionine (R)-S-oxide reductase MsrB [Frankiaceae bacterium]|nr:peptide-methionine (R)-S-oxide reductase MsrB [Frankiaceae bacterium]